MTTPPNNNTGSGGIEDLLNDDQFVLMMVGVAVLTLGPAIVVAQVKTLAGWGLRHHLLVPAGDAMVTLSDTQAGLDLPRLLIVGSAVLILGVTVAAVLIKVLRRRRVKQQMEKEARIWHG